MPNFPPQNETTAGRIAFVQNLGAEKAISRAEGRAEERAATQAILDDIHETYLREFGDTEYRQGAFFFEDELRDRIGGEPAPHSEPSLTVAAIAAHLRTEIATFHGYQREPILRGKRAALVDTLTWLESR